jgi:Sec-independent protein translocase protein TatA
MGEVVLIIAIIFGSIAITTLGCVWMGTSYAAKKKGLRNGASQREIEMLQQKVSNVQQEMDTLKQEVKRLIKIAKGASE